MLDEKIETYLNTFGSEGLAKVFDMAFVEMFRNYCIHNFNWFKGGYDPKSVQHKCERTWMRFYVDHGRLPSNISVYDIMAGKLTQEDIESKLDAIYKAYIDQYGFDIINPDAKLKMKHMPLKDF